MTEEDFCEAMRPGKRRHARFFACRQNMSRVFAADVGKKRREHTGTGGHSAANTIAHPTIFGNGF
jgi:hypothetical protein